MQHGTLLFGLLFLIILSGLNYSLNCTDGTPDFQCSNATPGYYCSWGQLEQGQGCAPQNNTVACSDGTPNFKCSTATPDYYCSYRQLVYGQGCAQENKTIMCPDGTANFKCSTATPGYYCSYGQLVYGQGCAPENKSTTCSDGTPNFNCSTATPGYYCSYLQLVYGQGCAPESKAVTCPDGTPNFKCSSATPDYYCSWGQLIYGQGCAPENKSITCTDGTPNFKCSSATQGYYCSYGQLVYGQGCAVENKTIACSDGTANFECSKAAPGYYCSWGQLAFDASCALQNNTPKCSDGTPNLQCSNATLGYYCSYGQLTALQSCGAGNESKQEANQSSQNISSDITPPLIQYVSYSQAGDQYTFTLLANDTDTGNSDIAECNITTKGQSYPMDLVGFWALKKASISLPLSALGDTIEFTCADASRNIGQLSFGSKKKQSLTVNFSVFSDDQAPIPNAQVYLDSQLYSYTGNDGSAVASAPEGRHVLGAKAQGFSDAEENITISADSPNKFQIRLTADIAPKFTPDPQLAGYLDLFWYPADNLTDDKWGQGVSLHPRDRQIKIDARSVMAGDNEVDAAKSMRGSLASNSYFANDTTTGLNRFIHEYDEICLQGDPPPAACEAWHDTDYKIIQSGKGVCADWAALTASFDNSMGLPTRVINIYGNITKKGGKRPAGTIFGHAFTEVIIPYKGWVTLDTLWNEYDNPCVYPKGGYYDCVFKAYAYLPGGTSVDDSKIVDRTDYYTKTCNITRCPTKLPESAAEAPGAGTIMDSEYNVTLQSDRALISITTIYPATMYEQAKDSDFSEVPQYLLDSLNATSGEVTSLNATHDDTRRSVTVSFTLAWDFSQGFSQSLITSQFDHTNYELNLDRAADAISPDYDSKASFGNATQIRWSFASPGEHDVRLLFRRAPILVVYSNDLRFSQAGKYLSRSPGITGEPAGSIQQFAPSSHFSLAYLLGDYGSITSADENKINSYAGRSVRLYGDPQDVSLALFKGLGKLGGTVVLANEQDALAVADAENQNGDAVVFYNPGRSSELLSVLGAQKPSKIILLNSTPVTAAFLSGLKGIAPVEESSVQQSAGLSLVFSNSSSISSKPKSAVLADNSFILIAGAIILVVAGIFIWMVLLRKAPGKKQSI